MKPLDDAPGNRALKVRAEFSARLQRESSFDAAPEVSRLATFFSRLCREICGSDTYFLLPMASFAVASRVNKCSRPLENVQWSNGIQLNISQQEAFKCSRQVGCARRLFFPSF